MKLLLASAAALTLLGATSAQAHSVNFDEFTSPPVTCCFATTGVVGPRFYPGVLVNDENFSGYVMNGSGWANMQTSGDNLFGTLSGSIYINFLGATAENVSFDLINGSSAFTFTVTAQNKFGQPLAVLNPVLTDFANPGSVVHLTFGLTDIAGIVIKGNDDFAIDTLSFDGAIPEPASWAMMIGGFAVAGAALRRKAAKVTFA